MSQHTSAESVHVVDLVLEPDSCHDSLISAARHEHLSPEAVEHLTEILPLAIAQLADVGDEYGALALEELYEQLQRLHTAV